MHLAPHLILILALAAAPLAAQTCGDCNLDQSVDVIDTLTAAQHAVGLITLGGQAFTNCDVDSSNQVTIVDGLQIAQYAVALPVSLICGGMPPAPGSCAMPTVLTPGVTVNGSTVGAGNDIRPDACALFSSAEDVVYSITLPMRQTLTVTLSNQSYASCLYIQTRCDDPTSELDCTDAGGTTARARPRAPTGSSRP
jgi:hypothetical protein